MNFVNGAWNAPCRAKERGILSEWLRFYYKNIIKKCLAYSIKSFFVCATFPHHYILCLVYLLAYHIWYYRNYIQL